MHEIEAVVFVSGDCLVDGTLYWEESDGQWSVGVVDGTDALEVICVSVVKEYDGVLDWWWSGDEVGENVDGGDWELDCGWWHGDVGEIWSGTPCVVVTVSLKLERWTWELEVLVHEEELKTADW